MSRIQFALCGECKPGDDLNPYKVTEPKACQEILSLINQQPQDPEEIAATAKLSPQEVGQHLKALVKASLVKQLDDRYRPSFAIFTVQDQERLKPLIDELSRSFARTVRENMNMVRSAYERCNFSDHGFTFDDLVYILVGAYTFDYGGLGAWSQPDLLIYAKEMPGGRYVFIGLEGELLNLQANWQWGHNAVLGRSNFFGHGEVPSHQRGRNAFPDQAYRWHYLEGWSEEEVTKTMEEIGDVLVALYQHPLGIQGLAAQTGIKEERLQEHLNLLQEFEYIGAHGELFVSSCPVVGREAAERIQELVEQLQAKLIAEVVKPNWERTHDIYKGTAPAGNEIDIREAFNPIYHLIFEQASRLLMEQGTIPWPKRHADGARYAVWIEDREEVRDS
ncbi:winged helix-turn-helix domain-containing protein [Dehalococcoidia bacterium]|nr:winged helix-turn-helix domain-containing protein [Dehalococcoidia bacterium]